MLVRVYFCMNGDDQDNRNDTAVTSNLMLLILLVSCSYFSVLFFFFWPLTYSINMKGAQYFLVCPVSYYWPSNYIKNMINIANNIHNKIEYHPVEPHITTRASLATLA